MCHHVPFLQQVPESLEMNTSSSQGCMWGGQAQGNWSDHKVEVTLNQAISLQLGRQPLLQQPSGSGPPLILISLSKVGVTRPFYRWGNWRTGMDVAGPRHEAISVHLQTPLSHSPGSELHFWTSGLCPLAMPETNRKMWLWVFLWSALKRVN